MKKKLYVVILSWCENSDDGQEISLVTRSRKKAERKLKELRDEELSVPHTYVDPKDGSEHVWTVMDDTPVKFYHHGYFPDFCSIEIKTYVD